MFLAKNFPIYIVRKNEAIPEIKIAIRIMKRCVGVKELKILFTATAVPVLVACMLYKVMKAKPATIVFMLPIKIKNCFLSFSPIISEPITAA